MRDDARRAESQGLPDGRSAGVPAAAAPASAAAASGITIGEIVDRARDAGFGFVIAFLTICAMPIPGASTIFGAMIVFGAAQMLIGRHRPWLPRWLRRRRLSAATLDKLARLLTRWTSWLEVVIRPRMLFVLRGPGWFVCALAILVLGLGLALPLPIPWSNVIFAAPILLYAIALLEADGLMILLGHAVLAAQVNLIVQLWDVAWEALRGTLRWLGIPA
jgi:hypothetical protein